MVVVAKKASSILEVAQHKKEQRGKLIIMITRLYSSEEDPNLCSLWRANLTNGDLYDSDGRYEIHPAGDVVCIDYFFISLS